jgi:hypothetical protein
MKNLVRKIFTKPKFLTFTKNKTNEALTPTEQEIQQNREELIKQFNATYTPEQLEEITKKGEEIQLMEIKPHNYKNLMLAKRISLFFNLPLSWFLTFFCEYNISNFDESSGKSLSTFYMLYFCDYLLFMNTFIILHGLRNIVLLATYIPTENIIEFKKLSLFNKIKTKKINVDELKRVQRSAMTPFKALKHKKTGEDFSMFSIGNWNDIALFNTLFPKPAQKERKPKRK